MIAAMFRVQQQLSRRGCRFFFNRATELKGLERLTSGTASLILITGPQDSGKSALLKEFEKKGEGHVISINMRSGKFDTAARFAAELKSRSFPFLAAASKAAESVKSSIPQVDIIGKAVLSAVAAVEKVDPGDLMTLLKELESVIGSWQDYVKLAWAEPVAAGFPTIIVDEANKLQQWSLNADEQQNLMALQEFFVMLTKETGRANVILCSSEDFFRVWLSKRVGYDRFDTAVVGDISKEEALAFFLEELGRFKSRKQNIPEEVWEDIYGYLGGRMLLLKKTAHLLAWNVENIKSEWEDHKRMLKRRSMSEVLAGFDTALLAMWTRPALGVRQDGLPKWTADDYTVVLKKMAEAEGGVVSLRELMKEVTKEAVYSLVQHNFVHYRDVGVWAKDLLWYEGDWPVIMPRSMPRFLAMKDVVKGLSKST